MNQSKTDSANPKIAILLSLYNGELYLAEQIESLLSQTYDNIVIVVRDDGSTDQSLSIAKQYAAKHPLHFHILPSDSSNMGASGGFAFLMDYVIANKAMLGLTKAYLMFCDQDDVWFEKKIELQVSAMLEAESESGVSEKPVLIHSDLEVVGPDKSLLAPSFISFQGLEIQRNRFPNLVISNLVTGCTAFINEPLAVKSLPISDKAIMHDWWLAIVAAAFGRIVFLDRPLIHYRQHANNTIGAKEFVKGLVSDVGFWRRLFGAKSDPHLIDVGIQAAEVKRIFGSELSLKENLALSVSAKMEVENGLLQRIFYRLARRF